MKFNFKPTHKKFISFRNIATCAPSQNIFDDISSPKYFSLLHQHERASSSIDHSKSKNYRPFQYGDTGLTLYVFDQLNWYYGRFSAGTSFGVWYGALEEETSIQEIIYHRFKEDFELFKNPKITDPFIVHQRAMFKAKCHDSCMVDLMREKKLYSKLISNDYSFCHQLGKWGIKSQIDCFFTPSARKSEGICTPIFNPVIIQDSFIYYFDLIIYRNFEIELKKSTVKKIKAPKEWLSS